MKYGFIGTGNIATAIIKGMIKNGVCKAVDINIYDAIDTVQMNFVSDNGVLGKNSIKEVIESSDLVVFAVKPYILPVVLEENKKVIENKKPIIVSVAASQSISNIEKTLGFEVPIVRVMPNVNAQVLASMSGICSNKTATAEDVKKVETIFNAIGEVTHIDESMFIVFAAIAGSSPAFTYVYIDSIAKAALKSGMNKKDALKIVAQSVLGSAKMILESDKHPLDLADMVSSPGGTTIEGICKLDENGFQNAIVHAVDATIAKDKASSKANKEK